MVSSSASSQRQAMSGEKAPVRGAPLGAPTISSWSWMTRGAVSQARLNALHARVLPGDLGHGPRAVRGDARHVGQEFLLQGDMALGGAIGDAGLHGPCGRRRNRPGTADFRGQVLEDPAQGGPVLRAQISGRLGELLGKITKIHAYLLVVSGPLEDLNRFIQNLP
jgi:hypothetical protein